MERRRKALVLLSGGLDSSLALKLMGEQAVKVEALVFVNPFSTGGREYAERLARKSGVKLNIIEFGRDYIRVLEKPKHGYGSEMNPCMDCRIFMLKKAWQFAREKGFDFLVTGEVLGERPFSQTRKNMFLIEREAGLEGKIVRPLSGKLLPETEAEKRGWIERDRLLGIQGRSRKEQLRLARRLGIKDYLTPAGGCLLTDPGFSRKMKDLLEHDKLTFLDIELLKLGRHFRVGESKVMVGRNERENRKLAGIASENRLPCMEVRGHMGPVTAIRGRATRDAIQKAAGITVRYSDSPGGKVVELDLVNVGAKKSLRARAISGGELERLRV